MTGTANCTGCHTESVIGVPVIAAGHQCSKGPACGHEAEDGRVCIAVHHAANVPHVLRPRPSVPGTGQATHKITQAAQMQIMAVYTGSEFRVHKSKCPDVVDLQYPEVHEFLILTGTSREQVTQRLRDDSLAAPRRNPRRSEIPVTFSHCCAALEPQLSGSGFAPGQPYHEIYAASPGDFGTKRNPTCASQGVAEHNAREYSRDGRAYVVEHIDAAGKRSKVSEFRNGRKVTSR